MTSHFTIHNGSLLLSNLPVANNVQRNLHCSKARNQLSGSVAETWRRVWGGGDGQIFRGPRFLNEIFSEKISIFTTLFSHRPGFSFFPFFFPFFPFLCLFQFPTL